MYEEDSTLFDVILSPLHDAVSYPIIGASKPQIGDVDFDEEHVKKIVRLNQLSM